MQGRISCGGGIGCRGGISCRVGIGNAVPGACSLRSQIEKKRKSHKREGAMATGAYKLWRVHMLSRGHRLSSGIGIAVCAGRVLASLAS